MIITLFVNNFEIAVVFERFQGFCFGLPKFWGPTHLEFLDCQRG